MSKRAEKAALRAYPPKRKEVSMTGAIYTVVGGDFERRIFKEGYEEAEKDTIERAVAWLKEHANDYIAFKAFIGGKCWEDLKEYMENEQ